jgi:hypothetical protein
LVAESLDLGDRRAMRVVLTPGLQDFAAAEGRGVRGESVFAGHERCGALDVDGLINVAVHEVGDGVSIEVVDARLAGSEQAPVLDLAVLVDDLVVLLPGPGAPSGRWADLAPEAVSVGRLPSSAVAWARSLPPRRWLLLVGEPAQERARGDSSVPLLTRREHGQIELSVEHGQVTIRTERCATGEDCQVELPDASLTRLLP